jgi:hypothetical protein
MRRPLAHQGQQVASLPLALVFFGFVVGLVRQAHCVVLVRRAPVNDFTGFDRPWRLLAEFIPDLRVSELAFGTGYLALGHQF